MRRLLHRMAPVVVAGLLLTGCATGTVRGQASPGPGEPVDVPARDLPVTGVGESPSTSSPATRWPIWSSSGHLSLREPELDDVVRGFLLLRDDVGSDPDDVEAHGS